MKMKFRIAATLFLLIQFVNASLTQQEAGSSEEKILVDQTRLKRQNGYGMWNNGGGGNFPMGNWNGPNSNGYGGPQPPAPDDSIKGSVGNKEEKPKEENENQNQNQGNGLPEGQGQGPWWPNGNGPNAPNGYNNGQNGNFPNGYNNGPMPFNGGNNNNNGEDGIKGSVGAATETTKSPYPPNGYGYGNRFGNGYGNNGNNFGFNRMAGGGGGYGNNFGRPILPRGERFFHGRRPMRY